MLWSMAQTIPNELWQQICHYLRDRSTAGDRAAAALWAQASALSSDPPSETVEFSQRLFQAWQDIARDAAGEAFWSYPVPLDELAEAIDCTPEALASALDRVQLERMQIVAGRSEGYAVGDRRISALTFHPPSATPTSLPGGDGSPALAVGDRVRVVAPDRPQYDGREGEIEQILSVSCRIRLSNGWSAFLPQRCLQRLGQ